MLEHESTQPGGGEAPEVRTVSKAPTETEPIQAERVLAEVAAFLKQSPDTLDGEARAHAAYLLNESAGWTFLEVAEHLRVPETELGAALVEYRRELEEDSGLRDQLGYLRVRLASASPPPVPAAETRPIETGRRLEADLPPLPPPPQGEPLTPEQLLEHATRQFGMARDQAWSATRRPEAVRGRYAGYLLLKEDFELTVSQIAGIVGKKEQTVNQALRLARRAAVDDYTLAMDIQELRARLGKVELSVPADLRPARPGRSKVVEVPDEPTDEEITNTEGFSEDELPDAIVLATARRYRVRPDAILGNGRKGNLGTAREAAFLAMREAGLKPKQIAEFTERKPGTVSAQLYRARQSVLESDELRHAINWILSEVKDIEPPPPPSRSRGSRSFGSSDYDQPEARPPRARPIRRFHREVPEEEQRLFEDFQRGQVDAQERFMSLYGELPERVLENLFESTPPAEALPLAERALEKAGKYFVPNNHPDFTSWAEKVIAKDLEELVSREGSAEAAAAIHPEDFVETATEYRRRYGRSNAMRITGLHEQETNEARKKAETFLFDRLEAVDGSGTIPTLIRRELIRQFPEDVRWMARVPYGLRRLAERQDDVPQLPRFRDLSDRQQEEVMGLVLVNAVRSLVA